MGLTEEAWVTTALSEEDAKKAIVLAGSLRRVKTGKKLVVLITLNGNLNDELRDKLDYLFDHVSLLEPLKNFGLDEQEELGKISAVTLTLANRCVYLSPNTLVLKNCDELFETNASFGAYASLQSKDVWQWDTSVWLLTPDVKFKQILKNLGRDIDKSQALIQCLKSQGLEMVGLPEKYNTLLDLNGESEENLDLDVSIANFGPGDHPIYMETMEKSLGPVEMCALSLWRELYSEYLTRTKPDAGYPQEKYAMEPIAIVGMSFRLPNANDVNELWEMFVEGREGIRPLPEHRWTKQRALYPCMDRKQEAGFLSVPIDEFDAKFFGISPKDAEYLDPQQRLLHEICWEALEDAMIDPLALHGTQTSFFVGSWIYDYQALVTTKPDLDFLRCYMGNSIAASAARLSHFYGTTGPSVGTESGCSAGIVAVEMAMKSLRNRTSNLAIAGGANLLIHPFDQSKLEVVVAPDGRCKTFDSRADGFGRAEGCAVLVMKRLSDAVRDGDNIWGLLRGSAMRQEGTSKSLGTPTVHSESLAMELALLDAGVNPLEVSYIETHGTGTPVGDPMEIAAITKAYSKGRTKPVLLGSVKTNLGHTESVSGITGIIKVLLSMKHEMIPKHRNLEKLNPNINLNLIPAEIPMENIPWPKTSTPRIAGVSSFGISGTDAHVILEEPPVLKHTLPVLEETNDRPLHILKVSAKTPESLQEILLKYQEAIEKNPNLADFAYSANIGRTNFNHRAVILAKDSQEAVKVIQEKSYKEGTVNSNNAKLCFLFTGQGSQYPNMASSLYKTSPVFKYHFDRCEKILDSKYGISLKSILWSDSNLEELSRTLYSQTSIFVVEYCLLKLWESYGVKPDYVLGHSLGEFAAAVAAGALTFRDALMLVAERSRLIDNLPQGKMLVIRADKKIVDSTIQAYQQNNKEFWVDYAAINSPEQIVVAGDSKIIEEFSKFCKTRSLKTIVLAATHAFHSRHMNPMLEEYRKIASSVKRPVQRDSPPQYISGMEGKLISLDYIDADYWVRHTREKVSFIDACKSIHNEGCTLFLEVGPHPVLSALTMMNIEESVTCLPSIRRNEEEWNTILDTLGKLYLSEWKGEIDWKGFEKFYKRQRVPVPFYQFNRKPLWTNFQRIRPSLHPLLGKTLSTASDDTIFENTLTLKNAKYIEDHVIGNTVIFPGAGYLEMCLIAGQAVSQGLTEHMIKPRRPVILRKMTIASPLPIYDSSTCRLQTTVVLEEGTKDQENEVNEIGYSIKVHRSMVTEDNEGAEKWALHASGKFLPIASTLPGEILKVTENIDFQKIQETWEGMKIRDFYERTQKLGLRFGPKFQSIETGWEDGHNLMTQITVPEDHGNYMLHPILADAMLQSMMLWKQGKIEGEAKLQVPVHIGEFIWIKEANFSSKRVFVYTGKNDKNEEYCLLLEQDGSALAYMKDIQFISTTVKLIEGTLQQKNTGLPKMWKEIWKPAPGPMQHCMDVSTKVHFDYDPDSEKFPDSANDVGDVEKRFCNDINQMTSLFVLEALYELGWKPEVGRNFTVEEIMSSLGILGCHKRFLRFFIRLFMQDVPIQTENNLREQYRFLESPPGPKEVKNCLQNIMNHIDQERITFRLVSKIGKYLAAALKGTQDVLPLLFPDSQSEPSASEFYDGLMHWGFKILERGIAPTIKKICEAAEETHMKTNSTGGSACLRVLEIGAGSGAMTKLFLDLFQEMGQRYKYHFTDISSAFFIPAEKVFKDFLENIIFQKFDMERDPLEQGFTPGYFDMILACEVIHISENMSKTLRNIRTLLKPRGSFIFYETIVPDPRITFCFGLLEGYWRCKDREHATLNRDAWKESLEKADFERVHVMPYYDNVHGCVAAFASDNPEPTPLLDLYPKTNSWLVFTEDNKFSLGLIKRMEGVNRHVVTISKNETDLSSEEKTKQSISSKIAECFQDGKKLEGVLYLWGLPQSDEISQRDQRQISLPFMNLCQQLVYQVGGQNKSMPLTYVVTQAIGNIDPIEVPNPNPATLSGIIRALSNEDTLLKITHFDLPPNNPAEESLEEVFLNFWSRGLGLGLVAFRNGNRLASKLVTANFEYNEPLQLPTGCERFQLVLPTTRLIRDLEYSYLKPYTVQQSEVEVKVHAMALNFRDVFTVMKPSKAFEHLNSVGLEYAGRITRVGGKVTKWKVGDRVMGLNSDPNLSLPSHALADETMLVRLPDWMTYAQGATLPTVFLTAAYCLINVAQMKKGDNVLIHTASGGVGLCAVQLAKHVGANIFATAGSPRKRKYLENLGIKHIYNSRSIDYGKQILEDTSGRGVDIVLNSLTGEGFKEASLGALAPNGRFIEMSKLNVWTEQDVQELRPDVFYKIVDVTVLDKSTFLELNEEMEKLMQTGDIQPIAHECFDALNIRGALNYMQKAKHIGKIICMMPDITISNSKCGVNTPLFNEYSTYLVTGGLGGIGYEVVKRMLQQGAKHLVIVSRSKPKPEMAAQIEAWNKAGKHVEAFAVDIGDFQQCQKMFQQIKSSGFPTIRGVMHAAGVLADALLANQDWEKFRKTFNAKVNGTWNLHLLTKDIQLEHFVLFSSLAAQFGSPGQSNHSASNSFMDAFCCYRRSHGLPAISINWGNWGEVGVATELDLPGILPISTSQGLLALETCLRTQTPHLTVLNVESFKLSMSYFPTLKSYVEDARLFGEAKSTVIVNSDDFWKEVDSLKETQVKKEVFKKYIKITARSILKMSPDESLDDHADFQSLGIDSLMMLEMRNGMQNILGTRLTLSVNQLKDCSNTDQLAQRLVEILLGEGVKSSEGDAAVEELSDEELKTLVREDCAMMPNVDPHARKVKQIKNVLMTGATGRVGPWVLRDLSRRPDIKKIFCLVRNAKKLFGSDRLKVRLQEMNLLDKVDQTKIVCLEGDITQEKLGLSEKEYDKLAENIDAVVHFAAKVQYDGNYSKDMEDPSNMRNVNVLGTKNVLEFAASKQMKHLLFPSTLMALVEVDKEGNLPETWQNAGAFDNVRVKMSYSLSKHVSEQIIRNVVSKHEAPWKVFRYPYIGGDSKTGMVSLDNNEVVLRWLAFMKLGCMPDILAPMGAVAVDNCARVTIDAFLNPNTTSGVYHVMQKDIELEQELVSIAKDLGIIIETVSYNQFRPKLDTLVESEEGSSFKAVQKFYDRAESLIVSDDLDLSSVSSLKNYWEKSGNMVKNLKLSNLVHDFNQGALGTMREIMRKDLCYLKEAGIFQALGIFA